MPFQDRVSEARGVWHPQLGPCIPHVATGQGLSPDELLMSSCSWDGLCRGRPSVHRPSDR